MLRDKHERAIILEEKIHQVKDEITWYKSQQEPADQLTDQDIEDLKEEVSGIQVAKEVNQMQIKTSIKDLE